MKRKKKPIDNPICDAEERSGGTFERRKTVAPRKGEIARCTTGQFSRLDGGYRRHCGPTAITNLILTLNRRYGYLEEPVPAEIFSTVSQIGQKWRIYWNTDILGHFGGTYDILTELYIRSCLRHYGIRNVEIRWHFLPPETQFIRALDAGKLLFLQLHHHPCYGSHHLLCYGYTTLHETGPDIVPGSGKREIYLLLVDGWSRRTRYLRLKSRGICHFYAIG